MSIKVTDSKIYDLRDDLIMYNMSLVEIIDDFETRINTFVNSLTLQGTTAENIKTYFSETHISVLEMIKTYIWEHYYKTLLYYTNLTQIDGAVNAVVDTAVLEKCTTDFETLKTEFNSLIATFGEISRSVSHLINLYYDYTYRGGSIANDILKSKFDFAAVDVEALRTYYEMLDEAEFPMMIDPMVFNRTSIKNLIAELRDKDATYVSDFEPGDLQKCETFYDANFCYENVAEFVESMEGQGVGDLLTADKGEYGMRKFGLLAGAAYSTFEAIKGAIAAFKDISAGIGMCATGNVAGGVILIVKGADGAVDAIDSAYGAVRYTIAFVEDDVYYVHVSGKDEVKEFVVEDLLGLSSGNGASGTIASTSLQFIETYYTSESLEWAIAYTAYNYVADEVVLPAVENYATEQISEAVGYDISGTGLADLTSGAVNSVGGGKLDSANDSMTFNELR